MYADFDELYVDILVALVKYLILESLIYFVEVWNIFIGYKYNKRLDFDEIILEKC